MIPSETLVLLAETKVVLSSIVQRGGALIHSFGHLCAEVPLSESSPLWAPQFHKKMTAYFWLGQLFRHGELHLACNPE